MQQNGRQTPNLRQARGFTLLEVMVAMAILAIALVGILKANVQSLQVMADSRTRTTLALLAAGKLAEVEAVGVAEWNEFQGDFGREYPRVTWRVEVEPTEVEELTHVAVVVSQDGNGLGTRMRLEQLFFVP
jgi:general secretion pathway protein I